MGSRTVSDFLLEVYQILALRVFVPVLLVLLSEPEQRQNLDDY